MPRHCNEPQKFFVQLLGFITRISEVLFFCVYTINSPLYKDVFVFVRAGEESLGVGADRDDLAAVSARKVHSGKNHLPGNSAALKTVKNAGVVNDHPLWSGALVRHFAYLHRFGTGTFFGGSHPCLENAAFLGLLVSDSNHGVFIRLFSLAVR